MGALITVAQIAPKSCHIRALRVQGMLQRLETTHHLTRPLSPIPVSGERYALPPAFVDGLSFLRPLVQPRGNRSDTSVNLLGGKLYLLTNLLIVEYDAGTIHLRNWWFRPDAIRILESFDEPPAEVFQDEHNLCFRWSDGQELVVVDRHPMWPSSTHRRWVDEAFSRFWRFDQGTVITDVTRRELRNHFGEKLNLPDIFIDGQTVAGWLGAYRAQHCIPLPTNATRVMRFDRKAFLDMIRVADEIDFSVSPVCFRHARGRGLLVERTATTVRPKMDLSDE